MSYVFWLYYNDKTKERLIVRLYEGKYRTIQLNKEGIAFRGDIFTLTDFKLKIKDENWRLITSMIEDDLSN